MNQRRVLNPALCFPVNGITMEPIKTAIVGFGISGQCFQAPILQAISQIELRAVVSRNGERVRSQLPEVSVYADISQLLHDPEIELVIIATPNDLHYQQAAEALRAGKHVVLEKPVTVNSSDGHALAGLAQQYDRKLSVYHSRRYDGDFLTIKQLLAEQRLGGIHTFYSSYNRYRPVVKNRWREASVPGAGILYDLGSHLIDQALCLFGNPVAVQATLRNQRPGSQATDHFHLVLSYQGTDVILHGNCLSTTAGPRFQVFGSEGSFIKHGMDPQEDYLRNFQGPEAIGWGEDAPEYYGVLTSAAGESVVVPTMNGGYEQFYQQMSYAIRHNQPVPVEPGQAVDVIKIIESSYLSNQENRTVFL